MTNQLPNGWITVTLGELGRTVTGKTPSTKVPENFNGSIPFIKPSDLDNGGYIHTTTETLSEKGLKSVSSLPIGAITVTCIGNLGKTGITTKISATNQQINSVICNEKAHNKYIYYFLTSMRNWLENESSATTISIVNKSKFSLLPVKLPPLAEQKEIATLLDNLLAQVDTLKTRLDAIPNILKRFRQSVLAAAVSGKLTEEWRGKKQLIKFKPLEIQLEKFRSVELPVLPNSWQWLRFDQIAVVASNLKDPLLTPDAIHIAPNHIESETGKLLEYTTIAKDNVTSAKHGFYSGQIIYSKIRPYLCKVTVVDFDGLCSADMYPVNSEVDTQYLFRWMLSSQFTDWASNAESRSVLPKINQKDLGKIPVPVPPIEEQKEIVRRVEELFAFADQIEQRVKVAQQRVNHLTQAILAKAFRGELTAEWREQNPDLISGENSAAALLAQIQASNSNNVKASRHSK